ncbi:MAG: GGDEF domain-containing protein [Caldilineaceae bacterium]|nr:GGDEF domain-containing protein [Caldilineaceae bacterium]
MSVVTDGRQVLAQELSPTQQILRSAARQRFTLLVRFFVYVALCVHACFIAIFWTIGVDSLAWINVGSVMIYMIAIWLGKRGQLDLAFFLCAAEILVHAAIATLVLGWASGFHYYISVIALFSFFHPSRRLVFKLLGAVTMFVLYVSLFGVSRGIANPAISTALLTFFERVNLFTFFLINVLLGFVYTRAVEDVELQLRSVNRHLDYLARTDTLTGLLNRRSMHEMLERALLRVDARNPFAVILGDIDDFKRINDQYGHHCGDLVLKEMAQLLRISVRAQDQIARWGGEEFLIFLPDTDREDAMIVAERVRKALEGHVCLCGDLRLSVTMSFGVSDHRLGDGLERTVMVADRALYAGKAQGKNCVVAAVS